jgi:PAS domain S-box-containing protein
MSTWSIERRLGAALLCTAVLPLASVALITWRHETSWRLAATVVVAGLVVAGGMLVRHVYREVRRHTDVERRLQSANRFLHSLLDNIPTMVFAKDATDLRFLLINRASEELLGRSRDDLTGKSGFEIFPHEQAKFFESKDREALATGDVVDVPEESISTTRGTRVIHTRKIPVLDETGQPMLLLGISMDITQRKDHERRILGLVDELQRHAQLLESSNRELESFCYSVSHDLRAPLRAINGFTQILGEQLRNHACEPEAQRCLTRICQASERMGQLIDDLLEFSRLGRQHVNVADLDMNRMVARTLEELIAPLDSERIDIQVEELLPSRGDRDMIQRVWQNLIDNAIKYSSAAARARIHIRSTLRDDCVVYEVKDNGVGFDMHYHEKIFGVFERLHGAEEFPGTGVGLAIARRILSRNNGKVWAESAPGSGATFYFSLPRAPVELGLDKEES